MDFKRLVKELRTKLIITQQELADLLGVSFACINRWETGKHEPTTKIKRRIVELCKENNIKLSDILQHHLKSMKRSMLTLLLRQRTLRSMRIKESKYE